MSLKYKNGDEVTASVDDFVFNVKIIQGYDEQGGLYFIETDYYTSVYKTKHTHFFILEKNIISSKKSSANEMFVQEIMNMEDRWCLEALDKACLELKHCVSCNMYNEYAESNQSDGSYKCYNCRN